MANEKLDQLCINTIRMLSVDAVEKAKSGHPGMPMGMAPAAHVLWKEFLRHNPANPAWPDRDRFVLSAGHGSMLLYSLLHLSGYAVPLDELKKFRQWGSLTPGHPEVGHTPGVETTTGPLGQGFANGVGMAIAERWLAERFNRPGHEVVNHFTYAIVSDGDLMEGVSHEAAGLAAHLKLGKIIYLYDDNAITIEGKTDLAFTEDRLARFAAYGWHVQTVADGNDLAAIAKAIRAAQAAADKPSIIAVKTIIGFGSPNKQGTSKSHGEPLGPDEAKATRKNLGWPDQEFHVPAEMEACRRGSLEKGQAAEAEWAKRFDAYAKAFPEPAAEFKRSMAGELPAGWDSSLPSFPADAKGEATRNTSGLALNAVAAKVPNLIGGSADLAPSTKTLLKDGGDFQAGKYSGRNFHFGVREHAMGSALNGMALHGGVIPYGATFFVFADYMRPPMRLAALMKLKVVYVMTHDSIGVGEDGPTHQPVEHLASMRIIPGMTVIRPCDANETAEAWRQALLVKGPVVLALTRQNLPTLDRAKFAPAANLAKGGYVLADASGGRPDVILIATGSEMTITLEAVEKLAAEGVKARVVSMPSQELFDAQPESYRQSVLPPAVAARVSVEAGVTDGWHKYVGTFGACVGLDRFGASGPYKTVFEKFGFTADNVVAKALESVERVKAHKK
jgi:transketolase